MRQTSAGGALVSNDASRNATAYLLRPIAPAAFAPTLDLERPGTPKVTLSAQAGERLVR